MLLVGRIIAGKLMVVVLSDRQAGFTRTVEGEAKLCGLPEPMKNHRGWCPGRPRLELDYAWLDQRIAIEVQGGLFRYSKARLCQFCNSPPAGKHGRGRGILQDMEKVFLAQLHGWFLIQITPQEVQDGTLMQRLSQAVHKKTCG